MKQPFRRRWPAIIGSAIATAGTLAVSTATVGHASGGSVSSKVAYVSDFNGSSNGGFNLFTDGLGLNAAPGGGAPPGSGSYSTASPAGSLTVTVTNIDVSSLSSSTALNGYDTLVLYAACNIGSDPAWIKTVNAFFDGGGKIIVMDSSQCANGNGGDADYSKFEKAFSDTYKLPEPHDPFGTPVPATGYTYTEAETGPAQTLTNHLPDCGTAPCNEPGNALTDAMVLNPESSGWCESLGATDANNVSGAVEAYNHNAKGSGLIVYNGETVAAPSSNGNASGTIAQTQKHLRLVFDNFLTQPVNSDTLPCSNPVGPQTQVPDLPLVAVPAGIGVLGLGAFVVPAFIRRRRNSTL